MSDRTVPFEAAEQALRLERIEGDHRLLSQSVKYSLDAMNSTLQNVQLESRAMSKQISDMHGLQGAHDSNNVAIGEMKRSLAELSKKIEGWMDESDKKNQAKWERYEHNRDSWRLAHEAENEDTKRELEKEIRSVRETVLKFMGFGSAVGALAGVLIAGFLWSINSRFNDNKEDTDRVERSTAETRRNLEIMGREHSSELSDIKLYLARGGRIPEEPYIPQSQRKTDGNQRATEQPASSGQSGK